jgi:CTP:molybdopterin cytidylyltransferase MocA
VTGAGRTGPVAGLLLAAGAGTRLSTSSTSRTSRDIPKPLVRVGGRALVERGVELLTAAGCEPVVVVLGAEADRVRAEADLGAARVVVADGWAEGMGASLRAGLAALAGCPAAVVALADQPLVVPEVVARLRAAWRGGAPAAVAVYRGARGTPALFDALVWDEVAASAVGDVGARPWLRANSSRVVAVECADVAAPDDLDTAADLELLRGRLEDG